LKNHLFTRIVYDSENENVLSLWKTKKQEKYKPIIQLMCYDEDTITSDDKLGQIDLDLSKMYMGAKSSDYCNLSMIDQKNTIKYGFITCYIKIWKS
jgi:hypothetical protein